MVLSTCCWYNTETNNKIHLPSMKKKVREKSDLKMKISSETAYHYTIVLCFRLFKNLFSLAVFLGVFRKLSEKNTDFLAKCDIEIYIKIYMLNCISQFSQKSLIKLLFVLHNTYKKKKRFLKGTVSREKLFT